MSGKFNSLKDEVVYRAALDGADDEIGTVEDIGWHGLVLDFYGKDYIVREDSQGFVTVESFAATYEEDGKTSRSAAAGNTMVDIMDQYDAFMSEEDWLEDYMGEYV